MIPVPSAPPRLRRAPPTGRTGERLGRPGRARERRLAPDRAARRRLERLAELPINFDPGELDDTDAWHHDERLQPLPGERPGEPCPGGSWEIARDLMRGYEFADPAYVRAHYDPDAPLEGRDMLLVVRYRGLRFHVGCRVDDVYERDERFGGEIARVWGWSYCTLRGHLEQGAMHWQVLKFERTGDVAFRIWARSRPAPDPNLILRLGFRLVGRREQLRFYDSTCARMLRLTEEVLRSGRRGDRVREVARETTSAPAGDEEPVHEELARHVERRPD